MCTGYGTVFSEYTRQEVCLERIHFSPLVTGIKKKYDKKCYLMLKIQLKQIRQELKREAECISC
jgi:hypothetical protein